MKHTLSLLALAAALPALADETRQLDSHEHGVGALNIAMDGTAIAMEFHAPGADIVGFEYAASGDEDHAAIDAAIAKLNAPLDLFVMPAAAACTVVSAEAALEGEEGHEDHDEDHHDAHDDDHDAHDKEHGDDHDEHKDEGHDHHAEHADDAGHTEFHATYTLSCANPEALTDISFAYFETFPNALELEVQIIASSGAQAFEVERAAPVLTLE